jgi:cytochrome c553
MVAATAAVESTAAAAAAMKSAAAATAAMTAAAAALGECRRCHDHRGAARQRDPSVPLYHHHAPRRRYAGMTAPTHCGT